jgi:3-isopropylmalate dehydrogenase
MTAHRIVVLPGDGIGPEVTREAERVLAAVGERAGVQLAFEHHPIGATAYHATGKVFPPETRAAVAEADAVLLGAVGDPSLDRAPRDQRPEAALLGLRSLLGAYANLRPVRARPVLAARSPLRPELLEGVDVLIVRELTGGLYFGEPRGRYGSRAVNTLTYDFTEVERIAKVAFTAAAGRRGRVTSVDKANVLEVSQLWRETVIRVAKEHPAITLDHQYVDIFAMRLVATPAAFDVVLTDNMFGDILSDEAAVLAGFPGRRPRPLRAHPRLGARHRRPGDREPHWGDPLGGDDAAPQPRAAGGGRGDRACRGPRAGRGVAHGGHRLGG